MIYTAYFTLGTPYQQIANEKIIPSLEKWELPHVVKGVTNLGSWHKNTAYKPKFILEMMELGENIVLLDVDCTIEKEPTLFLELEESDYDIAYHTLEWKSWYGYENSTVKE